MKRIEFPKGSERFANYDDLELRVMNRLVDLAADEPYVARRQMLFFHDLKVEFGLHLVLDLER